MLSKEGSLSSRVRYKCDQRQSVVSISVTARYPIETDGTLQSGQNEEGVLTNKLVTKGA